MAVQFLRRLGVRATRIAYVFGDTDDNVRHIDSRSYETLASAKFDPIPLSPGDLRLVRLTEQERVRRSALNLAGLRLRTKLDFEQTEELVWQIFRNHTSIGFKEAYEALKAMLPSVANARYGRALRIKLLIEEKLAWFAMAVGVIERSIGHAKSAMAAAVEAFTQSAGDKQYLFRYGESALIASICFQKLHLPKRAIRFIRAADRANEAAGVLPGSEHLRQMGSAFIQMGDSYDEVANKALLQATERMKRRDEASSPLSLLMTGPRQRAFLDPFHGWEENLSLVKAAELQYGKESNQRAVAARWAAAAGLRLADRAVDEMAIALLEGNSTEAPEPGRFTQLLSITPYLGLSGEALDRWLRFALQETPS